MTRLFVAVTVLCATVSAAGAQTPSPPEGDPGRFSFHRTENGFARLDLRTGQVSLCSTRPSGWSCQAAADDRTAYEGEINRLQNENVALKQALLERGLPLPAGVKPPAAPSSAGRSSDPDLDRVFGYLEKVWRRLIEMMANLQRDLGKT